MPPEPPSRAVAYVRESTEEQGQGFSPDAQREAIRTFAAENGLGPLSGEVTIVPGVDESPMAVVPMVETCARLALQAASRMAVVNGKRRIAIASSLRI